MLHTLAPQDFGVVRDLCRPLEHHLAVAAIIAGATPAAVYVDDPEHPHISLLLPWNTHRVYLAGTATNDAFNRAVAALMTERFAGRPAEFVVYDAAGEWDTTLVPLLPIARTVKVQRKYLRLEHPQVDWRCALAAGDTLRQVDAVLLTEGLRNTENLIEEMGSESPSVDDFIQTKFGYALQRGDALIGWCLSEYNQVGRCEVGIETLADYRRQGVATLTASALVEHALAQGITTIGWHCWAANTASVATGLKVGFVPALDYAVWYCQMNG